MMAFGDRRDLFIGDSRFPKSAPVCCDAASSTKVAS